MTDPVSRFLPDLPFPPYTFIGEGRGQPHPRRPGGHSHQQPEEIPPPLDPGRWWENQTYLRGIDLFNHGYYWESHEEWEGIWNAAGRCGPVAELCKGLIKLAAAGVKVRQGRIEGVRRHGRAAAAHFSKTAELTGKLHFAGLDLPSLRDMASELERASRNWQRFPDEGVFIVFERHLAPTRSPPD